MSVISLDKLDRRILFELDNDSRQSVSVLSRSLKQGRDRVGYRVDRLIGSGIIKQCTITVNPYRLGFTLFKTYMKLSKLHDRYEALIKLLRAHPRVYWIADCDGRWDLIFATFAQSPYEFFEIQNEILSQCTDTVIGFTNYTLVNVWMFRKRYLIQKGGSPFLIGGPPSNQKLTKNDWRILQILSEDSRTPLSEIARSTKMSESNVRYRLSMIEATGVVAGYRIELDFARLGMMFFKAQLFLSEHEAHTIGLVREFCSNHPNITYCIEQIGDAPIEVEIECEGYEQFTRIVNELRTAFPSVIRNVETVIIHKSRFKWVPYGELGE